MSLLIFSVLSEKYVEYKFGLSYGSSFTDYSGRNFHGSNGGSSSSSHVTHSDRGVYIGGGDKHVLLPEQFSSPKLGSTFSVLLWTMAKSQTGRVFFRGTGLSNNFALLGDSSSSSLNFQFCKSSSCSDNYLATNSFESGKWVLILLVNSASNFVLYTNKCQTSSNYYSYSEQTNLYRTFIGSDASNRPAFYGFVWYFVINQEVLTPSHYYSEGNFETCIFGPCVSCLTGFVDPDYGNICLSTLTDATKNSNSETCANSNGCSVYNNYQCTCLDSCTFNYLTGTCGCTSDTGVSTPTSCSCNGFYVLRSLKCCNPSCGTCLTAEVCLTCIDPNASTNNGRCLCKEGFYGTPSTSTVSSCYSCKIGCSVCSTSADCTSCFDPNAEIVSHNCVCKTGYFGSPSQTAVESCAGCQTCTHCNVGCFSCTSASDCSGCNDPNSELSGVSCICKSGYKGSPSRNFLTGCFICKAKCSECESNNGCAQCYDPNAVVSQNACYCKSGFYGSPSDDSNTGCFACPAGCSSCLSFQICTACLDTNAEVVSGSCQCKLGFYRTSSCQPCSLECSHCDDPLTCKSCFDLNAIVIAGKCACKPSYFGIPVGRDNLNGCEACGPGCLSCLSKSSCDSCSDLNSESVSNACSCKAGYFGLIENLSSTCSACQIPCKSCISEDFCTSCWDPEAVALTGYCKCRQGFFGSPSGSSVTSCQACPGRCESCINEFQCTSCFDPNSEVSSGDCICKKGFTGLASVTSTSTCYRCPQGCECVKSTCVTCKDPNAEVANNSCLCLKGFFKTESFSCQLCPAECATCSSSTNCESCKDLNMRIIQGRCTCNDRFYLNVSRCEFCEPECLTCSKPLRCETCLALNASPDLLGSCECDSNYFNSTPLLDQDSCQKCLPECKTCFNSESCSSCKDPNAKLNSQNRCECLPGFWTTSLTEKSCGTCFFRCETCENSSKCLKCRGDAVFLNSRGTCECKSGFYYPEDDDFECKPCPGFEVKGKCKAFCGPNEIFLNDLCVSCPDLCSICLKNLTCTSCSENSELVNGTCKCRQGFRQLDLSCVRSFFKFSLKKQGNREIILRFDQVPSESLGLSDLEVIFDGKKQDFTLFHQREKIYVISLELNLNGLDPDLINLTITKKPLFSTLNSELSIYSSTLNYQTLSSSYADLKTMSKTLIISALSTTAIFSNPASAWVYINTIQLIIYMPLNSLPYTQRVRDFSNAISAFNVVPNLVEFLFEKNATSEPYLEARDFGFDTSLFWLNFGKNLIVLLGFLFLIPLAFGLTKVKFLKSTCEKFLNNFKFNFFVRFWIQSYLELGLFALVQIKSVYSSRLSG